MSRPICRQPLAPTGPPSRAEPPIRAIRRGPPQTVSSSRPCRPPGPGQSQPYLGDRSPGYEPSRDARHEPYVVPYDPRGVAREPVPSDNYGASPMRPPGDIAGNQGGSILDLGRPSALPGQSPAPAQPGATSHGTSVATLPPDYEPETEIKELPPQFKRQLVDYATKEPAGTIIIDTPNTYLYLVLGNGKAMRYGIGVGREGFTWSGAEKISRMAEWPDWHPPAEMIERQPYLPRFMAGGETNPMGARASISARRSIASTAPTSRRPSAPTCRRAASAWSTTTSRTSTAASRSARASSCCRARGPAKRLRGPLTQSPRRA